MMRDGQSLSFQYSQSISCQESGLQDPLGFNMLRLGQWSCKPSPALPASGPMGFLNRRSTMIHSSWYPHSILHQCKFQRWQYETTCTSVLHVFEQGNSASFLGCWLRTLKVQTQDCQPAKVWENPSGSHNKQRQRFETEQGKRTMKNREKAKATQLLMQACWVAKG